MKMNIKPTTKEELHQQIYILKNKQRYFAEDVIVDYQNTVTDFSFSNIVSSTIQNLFKELDYTKPILTVLSGVLLKKLKLSKSNTILNLVLGVLTQYFTKKIVTQKK